MSPNAGGGGCEFSANEYSCAQINFGDLNPYLTCVYNKLKQTCDGFLWLYSSIVSSYKSDRKLDFAICTPSPIKFIFCGSIFAVFLGYETDPNSYSTS
jgi:hypothetical protein